MGSSREWLDAARIQAQLNTAHAARLYAFELLAEVDSTNTRLLGAATPAPHAASVCIAESQTAGRGRLGRSWLAPAGRAVTLSVGWLFRERVRELPAVSLAAGVAVARALARCGAHGIQLKWPNDIWFDDRKLGGILPEMRTEATGAAWVVIGVGINISLDADAGATLAARGVRAAGLVEACAPVLPSRNHVAGAILDELLGMLLTYEQAGFAAFRTAWTGLDALRGRRSRVILGDSSIAGLACGVDETGALLVDTGGQIRKFNSGEVSLRLEGDRA